MSLTQRLAPISARLAHTLNAKKANRKFGPTTTIKKPALAIFFGGPVGDLYQVKQWLPIFEQFHDQLPTVVLVKDSLAALELGRSSAIPIRMAGSADSIEPLANEWGLSAIFYVNNNLSNFSVLRLPNVRHIHLSHGESEKSSMTSNQLKAYDYCFVAGQAASDRIMSSLYNFDQTHLRLVGRPQLDQLIAAEPLTRPQGRKTLLYAPTWEGDRPAMAYSSVSISGEEWVCTLLKDETLRVIYRPHPKMGTRSTHTRKADRKIRELIATAASANPAAGHLIDGRANCNRALVSADIAIFDISAMALDFSVLKKPFFVSFSESMESGIANSAVWEVARPLHVSRPTNILSMVQIALEQGAHAESESFIQRHFEEYGRSNGTHRFQEEIRSVI